MPDAPGWILGVPPLAVEYAGTGQDESELQAKIGALIGAGTRFVWVVRLVGPRRVEVHERDRPVRIVGPGESLVAPGVLRNPVPIEALFERAVAHRMTLRNLLQREGYESLDEVREEGLARGERAGLVEAVETACALLDIPLAGERREEVLRLDATGLRALLARLRAERRWG
ncbi:MAG: hypothetical protein EXR72_17500 [Myxococcales bacterium]|nr:hypothetical protein [Myxococcales bacterium]